MNRILYESNPSGVEWSLIVAALVFVAGFLIILARWVGGDKK